ncbi:MAG: type III-B CRISPR-associated protein Cas10/Cmr2 [Deltaproteobacteria bacterium]|nr:type III-B CRISPR-associated protein Cas10/Cmr2 [Deltaproteobacteria bacterium]
MMELIWKAKLAAWTHDPAEKALVLLRDPAGHEGGTVRKLRELIFPEGIPEALQVAVRQADQWAAAADRPQFPTSKGDGRFVPWTQVRFAENPELIHPLSGEKITIKELSDIAPEHIKAASFDHFDKLTQKTGDDPRKTALAFWRLGPELAAEEIVSLWRLLPADTRVPDHTIWAHLDLASAFATAFAADSHGHPALLSMSFGPVQGFIAQARTTSDLWAGSHLLSRIAWEGLSVICEQLGPDAVIFPQLKGVPLVDLWLIDKMGLPETLFEKCDWLKSKTDANPLFGAALPNKFTAIVPQDRAAELAEEVTRRVREWVQGEARDTVTALLQKAGLPSDNTAPCFTQAQAQLADFPEVAWAVVPWSLVGKKEQGVDTAELCRAMEPFFPKTVHAPGFLGHKAWEIVNREIEIEGARFLRPNAGMLYPALHDLLDRLGAAAKSVRPFGQSPQQGYRCSLCGEHEWLCQDRAELNLPPGKRKETQTLWTKVASKHPSWARKGEHLCALCALKRLWPSRFSESVKKYVEGGGQRYVVSTHTMALATNMGRWLQRESGPSRSLPLKLKSLLQGKTEQAALPRKLAANLKPNDDDANLLLRRLPVLLDDLRQSEEILEAGSEKARQTIEDLVEKVIGAKPEAYYALIQLDGDDMGAWLSGSKGTLTFRESWHSQVQTGVAAFSSNKNLADYLATPRPPSPARHMAISEALNGFALDLVRHVVEDLYKGKLIYSGGDDVLAMVSVDDLLPAMLLLRMVYSGVFPDGGDRERCWRLLGQDRQKDRMDIAKGHVRYREKLYRVMGEKATASAGAVIAHHTAPLGSVLRALRQAEKRAKSVEGKDAFAVSLLKRSGGAVYLPCPWSLDQSAGIPQSPMGLLIRLRDAFAGDGLSRRAAYLVQQWACQLPDAKILGSAEAYQKMLSATLAYQFKRQSSEKARQDNGALAEELTSLALRTKERNGFDQPHEFLVAFLSVAEFLARQERADKPGKEAEHD